MEKRVGTTLKQGYVSKVTEMLNKGMIPTGNSDIMHLLIFGKTRAGKVIKDWKKKTGVAFDGSVTKSSKPSHNSSIVR